MSRRLAPLRPLALRAVVLYALLRVLIAMISVAASAAGAVAPDGPVGIVLLATVLGAIDMRRRGETRLWANLGFPTSTLWGVFAAVATLGELVLAVVVTLVRA